MLSSHDSESQHVDRSVFCEDRRTVVKDHCLGFETYYTLDAGPVAFPVVNHGPEHGPGPLRNYCQSFTIGWRPLKVMEHVRDQGDRGAEEIFLVW